MDVTLEDRPIESIREEVIDLLIHNYSHGVISAEAFERRLDQAMQYDKHEAIMKLVEDLPLKIDKKYSNSKESQFTPNYSNDVTSEDDKLISILGTNERSGKWLVPKEITIMDVLGTTKLDFTDAIFQHQNVTINIFCMLGEDTIYVPDSINVVSKMFSVLSSVENASASISNRQAPTITIKGNVVLGGLKIEKKVTTKEKWMGFADTLKSMFSDS